MEEKNGGRENGTGTKKKGGKAKGVFGFDLERRARVGWADPFELAYKVVMYGKGLFGSEDGK